MAAARTKKKSLIASILSRRSTDEKVESIKKSDGDKKPPLVKLIKVLAVIYFVIWILIGIFLLVFIYGNFKQGAFNGLFAKPRPATQQQSQQAPTETSLPGVGMVNIACVQSSLSSDAIQKLVQTGDASKLTADEKAKLEPCITQKEETTPAVSAAPTPAK
jgi:cytoskeletal protein RodZ